MHMMMEDGGTGSTAGCDRWKDLPSTTYDDGHLSPLKKFIVVSSREEHRIT